MRILKSLKTLIRCRDLERSRSFYTTVLGLEVVEEWQQSQAVASLPSAKGERVDSLSLPKWPRIVIGTIRRTRCR